ARTDAVKPTLLGLFGVLDNQADRLDQVEFVGESLFEEVDDLLVNFEFIATLEVSGFEDEVNPAPGPIVTGIDPVIGRAPAFRPGVIVERLADALQSMLQVWLESHGHTPSDGSRS